MHHNVSEIQQHPTGAVESLCGNGGHVVFQLEGLQDRFCNGPYMATVGSVADDELVAEGNATLEVQDNNVLGLLVVGDLSGKASEVTRVANSNLPGWGN